MVYGILKDRKNGEYRVITAPSDAVEIIRRGHTVLFESGCGAFAGFPDGEYESVGCRRARDAEEIFASADLVAKVKEFTPSEIALSRDGQMLLGCLHPAANPDEVDALLGARCIAFTAEDSHRHGSPNCEAAGKQGALFGLESMLITNGGKGKYVGGLAGAPRMKVLILGAGQVGQGALSVLYALGADCTVMDINFGRLRTLAYEYNGISTSACTRENIARLLPTIDMVLNCVKWDKRRGDYLIDRQMLSLMERGSVVVDISNDNPGAIETSRPTTLSEPRYTVDGIVHFCLSNIPSAVANTASVAYSAEMLPFILALLENGADKCCKADAHFRNSLTAYRGCLTHCETAEVHKRRLFSFEEAVESCSE